MTKRDRIIKKEFLFLNNPKATPQLCTKEIWKTFFITGTLWPKLNLWDIYDLLI